jgi:(2Fe-2S) ferredoxin
MVYPDGIWYAQVRASDVSEIVEEHLLNGRVIDRLALLKVPSAGKETKSSMSELQQWEA